LELLEANNNYKVVVVDNLDNSSEESLKRVKELTDCDPKRLQFRNADVRDKEGMKKGESIGSSMIVWYNYCSARVRQRFVLTR
jgi:UDP-glucose 4-epimerase